MYHLPQDSELRFAQTRLFVCVRACTRVRMIIITTSDYFLTRTNRPFLIMQSKCAYCAAGFYFL